MSSEVRRKVSVEELAKIKDAMDKETIVRVFKRYKALYLYLSGMIGSDVAKQTGITVNTICNLYKKYQFAGLSGIPDKKISGRPVRLTLEERNTLPIILNENTDMHILFAESLDCWRGWGFTISIQLMYLLINEP